MKKFFLFIIVIFLSQFVFAQNKIINLESAASKRTLYPATLKNLSWMGTSCSYSYIANDKLITGNPNSAKRDTVLSLDQLNSAASKFLTKNLDHFPAVTWIDHLPSVFIINANNNLLTYNIITKEVKKVNTIDENAENVDIEQYGNKVAYTKANNLYVVSNGESIEVTNDADKNIVNGQAVHRNEFGIEKGTFWSPKGNLLAFYRMDQTMVTDYPLVDIDKPIAEVDLIKYPMAGTLSHHVTVGIFNPITRQKIFLKTGEPAEQYLTNISWSPDEKYVFIAVLNREQNHMKLNQYDAATGDFVKTLFEEKNDKYVEPLHGLYFLKTKPDQFLWQSQRDGWNHLYLYDISGKLIKQVTTGNWSVTELIGTNSNDSKVYYTSTQESPLENHIYSVDIKSGSGKKLSLVKGTHTALFSDDGKYFIDSYNSTKIAKEITLASSEGKTLDTLLRNSNPLRDYKLGETSLFTVKSNDGSDLWCRMIKPINFDQTKKYPVIVYVYGGPHNQLISESWLAGAGLFLNYLAEKGYIVFTLDNHGTENRGLVFEQAIFRNLGTRELEDQMKGVEYLKKLPYVDTTRMGVHGWSYGGFMTISMLLRTNNVFKVAVAGGPVIDWKYYEVMYGERYMDTPQENPDGYNNASLLNYVKNLNGKLLIIHGTSDHTVVWQNSLSFIKKCVEEGKQVDYFVYPGHDHNVMGIDRAHLYHKIENYFNDYLK
jgi:dipeptidyl-peptidase-4